MNNLTVFLAIILGLAISGCGAQIEQPILEEPQVVVSLTATSITSTVTNNLVSARPSEMHIVTLTTAVTSVQSTTGNTSAVIPTATVLAPYLVTALPLPTQVPTQTPTQTPTQSPTQSPTQVPTRMIPMVTPTLWPTPDAEASGRVVRVPILMYHYVEPLPENADELRVGLTVQPGIFRQQLAFLHARGYRSVSLYDLLYHLVHGKTLPEKPLIFTFDDGYRGLYKHAFPHMQAFGFSGTVFLVTGLMDDGHEAYLTWEMAREMDLAGWKLEPHSKTHVQLSDRPFELVEYQVLGSMQTLQAHIGRQPRFFSYPSGRYDQQVIDYLTAVGFWGAVTTEYGLDHDLVNEFTWKRVRVPGRGSVSDLSKYLGEDISY